MKLRPAWGNVLSICIAGLGLIFLGVSMLWTLVASFYSVVAIDPVMVVVFVSGTLPLIAGVGFIKILFWRIDLDLINKTLSIPYWAPVDTSDDLAKNLGWKWMLFLLYARPRTIPLSNIRSVVACPEIALELSKYLDNYHGDMRAKNKYGNYLTTISQQQDLVPSSVPTQRSPVGAAVVGLIVPILIRAATPDSVLIVQLQDELIIRTLSTFRREDLPYLVEHLRALGVTVYNPMSQDVIEDIGSGHLLPQRHFHLTVFGALTLSVLTLGTYIIWLIFFVSPDTQFEYPAYAFFVMLAIDASLFYLASKG